MLPQRLNNRGLAPSPKPRVTAQRYFPVTGTETATFPPTPNPDTYSSPSSPGWETHRSLEWKHRREAQSRVFPRTAHSLQRTQIMHVNPIPALFPASKPTTILPAQLGMEAETGTPSCTPKQTPECSAGANFNTANQENMSWSQPVRKPPGKLKRSTQERMTSEYGVAAAPEASWTPALALKLQP